MHCGRGRADCEEIEAGGAAGKSGPHGVFQKSKKEENQVLQLPKDLPAVVEGDPRHFIFYVTPLSSKGLLSKQVRDALNALTHEAKGDSILKIRAFVAGSGDARRVRDIVSEVFTDRKQPLPVLSLVHAGGLPEDAQVAMEAIAVSRKKSTRKVWHSLAPKRLRPTTPPVLWHRYSLNLSRHWDAR
ncbi:MAG: hypothetical protein WDO73_12780 [Ignavibacteriota bacterium]